MREAQKLMTNTEGLRQTFPRFRLNGSKSEKNMARSESDQQYQAIFKEFNRLCERERSLRDQVARLEACMSAPAETSAAVERAMGIAQQLTELAAKAETFREARQIFELTNARLFLKFQPTKITKRTLNKLVGGVVTFGKAPPPIKLYEGATTRKKVKGVSQTTTGEAKKDSTSPPRAVYVPVRRESR